MAVANRTITFPSLVAGAQTLPAVATVTLAPGNCRGVNTYGGETWSFVGSLMGWSVATHPRWRLVSVSWDQRIREYESGALRDDYTVRRQKVPPVTFPNPDPATWGNWQNDEEMWFAGQATWTDAPSYLSPYYFSYTITDINFEFQYVPFPLLPLRDPDTNLIIRNANGIIMRGP